MLGAFADVKKVTTFTLCSGVPKRTPGYVPLPSTTSHATTEGPVKGLVPVGQSILSAGRPGAVVPPLGTHEDLATSGRIGATLRVLLTNPPQEVPFPDVRAEGHQAEIRNPEAEVYAKVWATTSLDIGLGQSTSTTVGSRP